MARALIVACGCRGRELGAELIAAGWVVRGTSRDPERGAALRARGIEPAVADPDRVATVLDAIDDVTLVYWLLGSARGDPAAVAELHEARLARFLEEVVDTPVRGFVYERGGEAGAAHGERGAEIVREAGARWRIPYEIVAADPPDRERWRQDMLAAAEGLTVGPRP